MFDVAELGSKVSKAEFEAAAPGLRVDLLNAQFDLAGAPFSVLVVLLGDDLHGVDAVLDRLHEWMDARYIDTHVLLEAEDDADRPPFWRFWRALPPRGRVGLYVGGWPLDALSRCLGSDPADEAGFARDLDHHERFEAALAADGTLLLKFWIHLPEKEHKKRLKRRAKRKLQLEDADWEVTRRYEDVTRLGEKLIQRTSTSRAPWLVIEGTDDRHRDLTAARAVRDAIRGRLEDGGETQATSTVSVASAPDALSQVDLASELPRDEYKQRRDAAQEALFQLAIRARETRRSPVLVFEGWDAAGKGGCIRRITQALHVRDYRVVPIAAPTDEELARHYLWRFWRQLPFPGRLILFDRSWYGRVLVERVEGFAREDEWRRAYDEINDFEQQLADAGMPVIKFWLHLDPDEQLRRFREREATAYKKYKITEEDYRNRDRWDEYVLAVNEMVARTSTLSAPWTLVPANDKRFARVQVLETVCERLKEAMDS